MWAMSWKFKLQTCTNRSAKQQPSGDSRHMKPKPKPFQVEKQNRHQLQKLTGSLPGLLFKQEKTPLQLFKASLYNEADNPVSSQAYVGVKPTDGLSPDQDPIGGGRVRNEEVPVARGRGYQSSPNGSMHTYSVEEPLPAHKRKRGYWQDVMSQQSQQQALEAEQTRQTERIVHHATQQGQLHDVGQPHDQSACPRCIVSHPSKLGLAESRPLRQMAIPTVDLTRKGFSPEALRNHQRMLEFLNLSKSGYRPSERLLKAWYDNSTDPLAQNLLHKMGLAHNSNACPSCQRGEQMRSKTLFE